MHCRALAVSFGDVYLVACWVISGTGGRRQSAGAERFQGVDQRAEIYAPYQPDLQSAHQFDQHGDEARISSLSDALKGLICLAAGAQQIHQVFGSFIRQGCSSARRR